MAKSKTMIAVALASLMGSGIALAAENMPAANAPQMEKCYGVAKAGKNDCANKGHHSCAGQSKKDNDPSDFKNVARGTCMGMKGSLMPAMPAPMPEKSESKY